MKSGPPLPEVRALLQKKLPTTADLDRFCQDYFPSVFRRFIGSHDRLERTNLLLAMHSAQEIVAALANLSKQDSLSGAADRARIPTLAWALIGVLAVSLGGLGYYVVQLQQRVQPAAPAASASPGPVPSPTPGPVPSSDPPKPPLINNQPYPDKMDTFIYAPGGLSNTGTMIGNSVQIGTRPRQEKTKP